MHIDLANIAGRGLYISDHIAARKARYPNLAAHNYNQGFADGKLGPDFGPDSGPDSGPDFEADFALVQAHRSIAAVPIAVDWGRHMASGRKLASLQYCRLHDKRLAAAASLSSNVCNFDRQMRFDLACLPPRARLFHNFRYYQQALQRRHWPGPDNKPLSLAARFAAQMAALALDNSANQAAATPQQGQDYKLAQIAAQQAQEKTALAQKVLELTGLELRAFAATPKLEPYFSSQMDLKIGRGRPSLSPSPPKWLA